MAEAKQHPAAVQSAEDLRFAKELLKWLRNKAVDDEAREVVLDNIIDGDSDCDPVSDAQSAQADRVQNYVNTLLAQLVKDLTPKGAK